MNLDSVTRNLRILWRANAIMAEIRLRHAAAQSGLYLFAGLICIFALAMFGVAGFFALQETYGTVKAALIVGGANLVVAVVLALVAGSLKPGRDLDLANEVNKAALDALASDLKSAEADVNMVRSMLRNPLESALPALLAPALSLLFRSLRKGGKD